jgi:hypothetical protein
VASVDGQLIKEELWVVLLPLAMEYGKGHVALAVFYRQGFWIILDPAGQLQPNHLRMQGLSTLYFSLPHLLIRPVSSYRSAAAVVAVFQLHTAAVEVCGLGE